VFRNLRAVMQAGGGELDDIAKVSVMLADLGDFAKVNEIMATYFRSPYPARATYQVAGLPRGARIEVEGIAILHPADTIATEADSHGRFDQPKGQ
jgi:reactive intermediate/imine deaminase